MIPDDATHVGEFYGTITYYKLSQGLHYNTVIDHPEECWQKYDIWHAFEDDKWVCVGSGFSPRRLKELNALDSAREPVQGN